VNIFYKVIILVFLNGITALAAQVIFFREILNQVHSNELVLAALLSVWMVSGAFAGGFLYRKFFMKKDYSFLLLSMAFLPVINAFIMVAGIIVLRYLKSIFNIPVEILVGSWDSILMAAAIFAPAAIMLTLGFCVAGEILKREKAEKQVKFLYITEAAGAMVIGILYTLFLSSRTPGLELIYWLGIINMAAVYVLFREKTKQGRIITVVLIFSLILYIAPLISKGLGKVNSASLGAPFSKYTVLYDKEEAASRITIAKKDGVYYGFINGHISCSKPDRALNEKTALALASGKNNNSIMIINGGYTGGVETALGFRGAEKVTAVENNPYMGAALAKFFGADIKEQGKVKFVHGDVMYYLLNHDVKDKFDLVVLNAGVPATIYSNRYYTREFFLLVKKFMKKDGRFVFYLPGGDSFMAANTAAPAGIIYRTASSVFENTGIIPGDEITVIGSDGALDITAGTVKERVKKMKIKLPELNSRYIEASLDGKKTDAVKKQLKNAGKGINSILAPSGYLNFIRADLYKFKDNTDIIKILLIAAFFALAAGLAFNNRVFMENKNSYIAMMAMAGSAVILEIVLIFIYQGFYGYIYKSIGMLFAFFMFGIVAGGAASSMFEKELKMGAVITAATILNAIILLYIYGFKGELKPVNPNMIISLIIFTGIITGAAFNIIVTRSNLSMLYSMDLIGGAFGAVLAGIFLLPVLGVQLTIVFNMLLLSGLMMLLSKR